jgi:glycosyltransferase involved in cell wall biosynthesis
MRIVYFSPYDLLRPRTNQVSDVRFCEAFAENACEVELVVPQVQRKDNLPKESILTYYEVKQKIKLNFLSPIFKNEHLSKIDYLKLSFWCLNSLLKLDKKKESIYIFSRSEILLLFSVLYKKVFRKKNWKIAPWLHELKNSKFHLFIYRNSDLILATNNQILRDLELNYFIQKPNFYTLNPISEYQVKNSPSTEDARAKIAYHSSKKLIVYTGKLYKYQFEIELIIEAIRQLPDYYFIITGGKPDVLEFYKDKFKLLGIQNVHLTGYLPDYREIKYYQFSADLLLSFYTQKEHDVRYNLPNKLAEYMLTKHPIITPFYPASKDFLNHENAFEVPAENVQKLVETIKQTLANEIEMKKRAEKAYLFCVENTYKKRIEKLLTLIQENDY